MAFVQCGPEDTGDGNTSSAVRKCFVRVIGNDLGKEFYTEHAQAIALFRETTPIFLLMPFFSKRVIHSSLFAKEELKETDTG